MLRLKPRQRDAFGGTLLELANFAAAALVFGQFVRQQPLSWRLITAGIAIWMCMVAMALLLVGDE